MLELPDVVRQGVRWLSVRHPIAARLPRASCPDFLALRRTSLRRWLHGVRSMRATAHRSRS